MARSKSSHSNGNGHTVADDIASIEHEIGQLMHDIEARVGKLNALARRSAKDAANGAGLAARRRWYTAPGAGASAKRARQARERFTWKTSPARR